MKKFSKVERQKVRDQLLPKIHTEDDTLCWTTRFEHDGNFTSCAIIALRKTGLDAVVSLGSSKRHPLGRPRVRAYGSSKTDVIVERKVQAGDEDDPARGEEVALNRALLNLSDDIIKTLLTNKIITLKKGTKNGSR